MTKFVHIHSSSRFDRSPESLHAAFTKYTKQAIVVTFTEVEFEIREKAVVAPGWKKIAGDESNRNDAVVAWHDHDLQHVYHEFLPIKGSKFVRYGSKVAEQLYATIVVLEDGLGKSVVISVIHLPSSVEGDLAHGKRTERTAAWFTAVRQVRKRTKAIKRKFGANGAMLVADWNIDFKKPWARAVIKAAFPTWTLTWKKYPAGGTHGKRVIDATLIKGDISIVKSAELIADDSSSDHRPYKETLGI